MEAAVTARRAACPSGSVRNLYTQTPLVVNNYVDTESLRQRRLMFRACTIACLSVVSQLRKAPERFDRKRQYVDNMQRLRHWYSQRIKSHSTFLR